MKEVAKRFATTVLPAIIKPLRVLWNEMIAFLFFALAFLMGLLPAWRYYNLKNDPDNFLRMMLTGTFGVVMLAYGIYSIVRARKIGRS
ncbi:MAG: hypothetical protein U0Q16_25050 [Bryobacteraceae bacterium]